MLWILLTQLIAFNAKALPSNEGQVPPIQNELLNYGSLTVVSREKGDDQPRIFAATNAWGFPSAASASSQPLNLNELMRTPAGWYMLNYKKQFLPVFIMPEGKVMAPSLQSSVVEPTTPVDQVLELAKIANGSNVRTELDFRYRMDFADPGMLNSALFYLQSVWDSEFSSMKKSFDSIFCDGMVSSGRPNIERIDICQALKSPDPSNLLGPIVRVSSEREIELRDAQGVFKPHSELNAIVLKHSTGGFDVGLPGSYLLKTENKSLELSSKEWVPVTAGASPLRTIYEKPRPWKALIADTGDSQKNYLLLHFTNDDLGVWSCPESFKSLVGSQNTNLNDADDECRALHLQARNVKELSTRMESLRGKYKDDLARLDETVEKWRQQISGLQAQAASADLQLTSLKEKKKQIDAQLNSNLYNSSEKDYSRFQNSIPVLQETRQKTEAQISQWLKEAPEKIKEAYNQLPSWLWIVGAGLLCVVGILFAGVVAAAVATTAAAALTMEVILGGVLVGGASGWLGIAMGKISYSMVGMYQEYGEMKEDYEVLKVCHKDLSSCKRTKGEAGQMVTSWKNADLDLHHAQSEMARIEGLRSSPEYQTAKDESLRLTNEASELQAQIEALLAQITDLKNSLAALENQIKSAEVKAAQIPHLNDMTFVLLTAFEQSLADSRTKIVRHVGFDQGSVDLIVEDLSKM